MTNLRDTTCPVSKSVLGGRQVFMGEEEALCPPNRMPEIFPTRMSGSHQRPRLSTNAESPRVSARGDSAGILDERVLLLVFESIKWDIHVLCATASVSRKLRAVAHRVLWREVCVYRAPRMIEALTGGSSSGRIGGGWHALAKLLFFCSGCGSTRHFQMGQPCPGHFVKASRFSKTSGRSFLSKKCKSDLLYVSDPCEHPRNSGEDDLGVYRGVFRAFVRSRTRACLVARRVGLEEKVRCPFCGSRVWSMTAARLVPRTAAKRLGSTQDGGVEYFVCVNGHMHGACWLIPLSSDEGESENEVDDDGYSDDGGGGGGGGDCGPSAMGGAGGSGLRNGPAA